MDDPCHAEFWFLLIAVVVPIAALTVVDLVVLYRLERRVKRVERAIRELTGENGPTAPPTQSEIGEMLAAVQADLLEAEGMGDTERAEALRRTMDQLNAVAATGVDDGQR